MKSLIVLEQFETLECMIWSKAKYTTNKTGTITEEKAEEVLMNTKWRKVKLESRSWLHYTEI